jgi:aminoglycoside phosphotransferase (APT) family kinase protein
MASKLERVPRFCHSGAVPIPDQRDPEITRKALTEWLAAQVGEPVELSEISTPGGTGFSNETLLFDATWDGGTRGLVARLKPRGYAVFPDLDPMRQWRTLEALNDHTDVPVPAVLWAEDDDALLGSPFFVMEKVEGLVPSDVPSYNAEGFLLDLTPDERRALWESGVDAMARVHRVDWQSAGFGFLDCAEDGARGLPQYLAYLERYFEWAARGKPYPEAERAWGWLANHVPTDEPVGLCWGDSRPSNMLFHEGRCAAVLDWEMVRLGAPEQDLGWWLFFDRFASEGYEVPRLEGLPDRDATIALHEALIDRSVRTGSLMFYEVLAGFYFALIMMRIGQMMIEYEWMPADSDFETNNPSTHLLSTVLDEVGA